MTFAAKDVAEWQQLVDSEERVGAQSSVGCFFACDTWHDGEELVTLCDNGIKIVAPEHFGVELFAISGYAINRSSLPEPLALPRFHRDRERRRAFVRPEAVRHADCKSDFESSRIVFGFELEQIEDTGVNSQVNVVWFFGSHPEVPCSDVFLEQCEVVQCDISNCLATVRGVAFLECFNPKPFDNLENGLLAQTYLLCSINN